MQRNRYSTEFKEQALSKARQRGSRTLESVAIELNMSLEERLHKRQSESKPLAEAFHEWMLLQRQKNNQP